MNTVILADFLARWRWVTETKQPAWLAAPYEILLREFDLPDLVAAAGEKRFLLINPRAIGGEKLDEADALQVFNPEWEHVTVHVSLEEPDVSALVGGFLQAPSFATRSSVDPILAMDGGQPVRRSPFPTNRLGADWTGVRELQRLKQALATKTLFRHYGAGKPVTAQALERRLVEHFGCRYALGVTSGSAALSCALAALAIGPGDEVILPAYSWWSCYNSIVRFGAVPVFCEIDRTLNLDPEDARRRITSRTKAIMVVHYQGGAARMNEILALARQQGVKVVEDAAQAIGARHQGRYLGTLGDVGAFSFQGNKILCAGEGGALLTNDPLTYERAVRFHDMGVVRPAFAECLGRKTTIARFAGDQYRMSEPTAAIALAQLERLEWMLERTRAVWRTIRRRILEARPQFLFRESPDREGDAGITLFLDAGQPARARKMAEALAAEGLHLGPSSGIVNVLTDDYISARRLTHPSLPPFGPGCVGEKVRYDRAMMPVTDEIVESFVAIGIGPRFTQRDARDIAEAVIKVDRGLWKGTDHGFDCV